MASITFLIQSSRDPAGIYIRLADGRKFDYKTKTKFIINPDNWSKSKGLPKNLKDPEQAKLNKQLSTLKDNLLASYNESVLVETINLDWLKNFIDPREKAPVDLLEYFDYYVREKSESLSFLRNRSMKSARTFLINFQAFTKSKHKVHQFDNNFKQKVYQYSEKIGYANNTTCNYLAILRTVVIHAEDNNMLVSSQLHKIEIEYNETPIIYLNAADLVKLEKLSTAEYKEDLELWLNVSCHVRDWLLISCEVGQRFSDFMRFNEDMIRWQKSENKTDIPLIEFTQSKTGKIMSVPLSKKAMALINRNGGNFPKKIRYKIYVEQIKDICKRAGINELSSGSIVDSESEGRYKKRAFGTYPKWQLIASHIGRRSFATNYYGVYPTPLLMGVTGHTTEVSFLRYIGKTDTQKAEHLARLMYGG